MSLFCLRPSSPTKHRRAKRVVNQAETGPIKSSNGCRDSPGSASLPDRDFGRIRKSCHLINIQNTCRSDAAHFVAVTMVLLANAVSKHEQRQRQAERWRVEERAALGQQQRIRKKRITILAANTPQSEDTPECHLFSKYYVIHLNLTLLKKFLYLLWQKHEKSYYYIHMRWFLLVIMVSLGPGHQ